MRILYIEHYAGSDKYGMEFRPYYLARNWVKAGHKVFMMAGSYSHLRIKNPTVERNFQREIIDGIDYIWIKTCEYKGNNIGRVVNVEQFLHALSKNAKSIAEKIKPDVVIASSTYPMDTYPAQKICQYSGAALIHEVHDMWPITPMELYGLKASNPIIKYIQKAEDSFCKNADKIVSIVPFAEDYYIEHGMPRGHFEHVPNGIIKEDWPDKPLVNPDVEAKINHIKANYNRLICFIGSHTKSYSLDTLIKAAKKCADLSVAFLFVGGGNYKEELKQMANDMKLSSVYFMDPIPKKEIPGLLSLVDGIYVGAARNKMFRFGIAMNKLFDSLASGRPIIFAAEVPNDYIKEYDCGISVEAENVDALADGIRKFCNCTDEELDNMGSLGRKACMERFEYENISKTFIDVMERAIMQKKGTY